ncbi:hypothetical protein [Luteipulveratus mongoliensis]|uniref:Uncharacterized protein n=1 Tax=Luteipulveratus mongoliensis TaxID=571913 RepID=A0A0K1JJ27_9MICO|nr:hypothetical protein [Luteipulveratus mongoliensis]AKU16600.1 hypothetical protein VV02_13230 [Luteipulveratus mongoliensis]
MLQLEKDERLLEDDGTMLWLVRDMDKMPPAVRRRMDELRQEYPDTFVVREITEANEDRVFEELRELLRTKELEHWSNREADLEMTAARAGRDGLTERASEAVAELTVVSAQREEIARDLVTVQAQRADRAQCENAAALSARIAAQRAQGVSASQYADGSTYQARIAREEVHTSSRGRGYER